MLRSRRWRWLRVRIEGLLSEPESRLWRILNPEAAKEVGRVPHGR